MTSYGLLLHTIAQLLWHVIARLAVAESCAIAVSSDGLPNLSLIVPYWFPYGHLSVSMGGHCLTNNHTRRVCAVVAIIAVNGNPLVVKQACGAHRSFAILCLVLLIDRKYSFTRTLNIVQASTSELKEHCINIWQTNCSRNNIVQC